MADAGMEYLALVKRITDAYPAFAPLMEIPEIGNLLIEASVPGASWSPDKFQAKLQSTDWWKNNSDSSRQWQITKLTQPGQAAQSNAQVASAILAAAGQAGVVLSPAELMTMVNNAQNDAWTPQQMQENIVRHAESNSLRAGTIQNAQAELGGVAADYGVPLGDRVAFSWASRIAAGQATTDGFQAWARNQAKRAYPPLAEDIDAGMTVREIADPYLQIAQQTLGIDPNRVKLNDPKWSAALQSRDDKGKITGPMTTLDWQRKLMEDPAYGFDHTAQAQAAATQLVEQLGDAFGVSA